MNDEAVSGFSIYGFVMALHVRRFCVYEAAWFTVVVGVDGRRRLLAMRREKRGEGGVASYRRPVLGSLFVWSALNWLAPGVRGWFFGIERYV